MPFTAIADSNDSLQTLAANGDFETFPAEHGVSIHKAWTVTFSGLATSDKINGVAIRKGDSFIPVKIQLNGNQAIVTPVEAYERGATYTLKIFLDNGKRYNKKFTTQTGEIITEPNPGELGEQPKYDVPTDAKWFTFKAVVITNYDIAGPKEVCIPSVIDGRNYWDGEFADNLLTEVLIPDSMSSIGGYAFVSNRLTEVSVPAKTTLGDTAFDKAVTVIRR